MRSKAEVVEILSVMERSAANQTVSYSAEYNKW
jgi:hypothetical protein